MNAQTYTKACFPAPQGDQHTEAQSRVKEAFQRAKEAVQALPKPLRDFAAIEFMESCSFPRQANLLAIGLEQVVTSLKAITTECEFAEELELTLRDEETVCDNSNDTN